MKSRFVVQDRQQSNTLPASALSQHAAVQTAANHTARSEPASALTESRFGQDFSQLAVHSVGRPENAQPPCYFSPRTCPFGGACHLCPASVRLNQ